VTLYQFSGKFIIQLLHNAGFSDIIHKLNAMCHISLYCIYLMLVDQFSFFILGFHLSSASRQGML
jgi:hypothetical protein